MSSSTDAADGEDAVHTHNLAEGAGAAAWQRRATLAGQTVVGVLSGGNLDLRELARIVAEACEQNASAKRR